MGKREATQRLEAALIEMGGTNDYPLEHLHATGLYGRQLTIPAGHCVTGKIHRKDCINVLLYGRIIVSTEDDEQLIQGPYAFVSPAGTKRAVYTVTDCAWLTVHASKETDLDKLEQELIAPSYAALEHEDIKCLG